MATDAQLTHPAVTGDPLGQVGEPLVVERSECSDKVWALLEHRTARIERLQLENDQLQQRLCRYEGHLPIHDHQGQPWCELCGEKLTARLETDVPTRLAPPHAPQPVAMVKRLGATVRLEWASVEAAHNATIGPLYAAPIPPAALLPAERACCGTFVWSRHRSTCVHHE